MMQPTALASTFTPSGDMNRKTAHRRSSVRIIGGSLRKSKLDFPEVAGLRPTAEKTRETLFNWIRNEVQGEYCLDLFAGSGALGVEAFSRGAEGVVFVEVNAAASGAILQNVERLNICNAEINCIDVCQWIGQQKNPLRQFGLVFLDPPFADNLISKVCRQLANSRLLKRPCRIYVESGTPLDAEEMPASWSMLKSKRAGSVAYYLYLQE
jgi:16S rRNA (guanine966-N2)-methyltransferase